MSCASGSTTGATTLSIHGRTRTSIWIPWESGSSAWRATAMQVYAARDGNSVHGLHDRGFERPGGRHVQLSIRREPFVDSWQALHEAGRALWAGADGRRGRK